LLYGVGDFVSPQAVVTNDVVSVTCTVSAA
jgi:hypothetical protein